jgi:hypothetical protein
MEITILSIRFAASLHHDKDGVQPHCCFLGTYLRMLRSQAVLSPVEKV